MKQCLNDVKLQELANTAWALATAGEPVPAILDPLSVLNSRNDPGEPQLVHYEMWMQCLAMTGQIVPGFVLLTRVKASGLLSHSGGSSYQVFRTLIEACRRIHDSIGISHVRAAMDRLCLIALSPGARVLTL